MFLPQEFVFIDNVIFIVNTPTHGFEYRFLGEPGFSGCCLKLYALFEANRGNYSHKHSDIGFPNGSGLSRDLHPVQFLALNQPGQGTE